MEIQFIRIKLKDGTTKYEGYEVYGTISIPKIKIEYPILENATPRAIKIAVAYSAGVGINRVGNTVISGHNYRNGLFFSNNKKLNEATPTDASFYNRDTAGPREITLSTCTNDGNMRTIVLAKEIK